MTNEEMKKWIDNATYPELLYKWRFEPLVSSWFTGPVGDYFSAAMVAKRGSDADHTAASKQVGWDVII